MHIVVVEALLVAIYLGNELILIDIKKPFRSSACLVRLAGPCPAEPFQLVPAQLGLSSAGLYQLRACESPPKRGLFATPSFPIERASTPHRRGISEVTPRPERGEKDRQTRPTQKPDLAGDRETQRRGYAGRGGGPGAGRGRDRDWPNSA